MADNKKANSDPRSYDFDSRSFPAFQRIRVTPVSKPESKEYQDLPRMHQQALLNRLIDYVREL